MTDKPEDKRSNAKRRYEQSPSRCEMCDLTGMVSATEITTGVEYAFRCNVCNSGLEFGYQNIPAWDPTRAERFKPHLHPTRKHRNA